MNDVSTVSTSECNQLKQKYDRLKEIHLIYMNLQRKLAEQQAICEAKHAALGTECDILIKLVKDQNQELEHSLSLLRSIIEG